MTYQAFFCQILVLALLSHIVLSYDSPRNTVIFLNPTPYLHSFFINSDNTYLSNIGIRQAYLIGKEIYYLFTKIYQTFDDSSQIEIYTDNSTLKFQTAQGILRGIFDTGTGNFISSHDLQKKSIPPIKSFNFDNFSNPLKDSSIPHYMDIKEIHSVFTENDRIFNMDQTCPNIRNRIIEITTKSPFSCTKNLEYNKVCKSLSDICPVNFSNDNELCKCLDFYKSGIQDQKIFNKISDNDFRKLQEICDNFDNEILESSYESESTKLMTHFLLQNTLSNLMIQQNKAKFTIFIISEFQMKSLLFIITHKLHEKMPKYGNMLILSRYNFTKNTDFVKGTFNKQHISIFGKSTVNFTDFSQWIIKNTTLSEYEKICNSANYEYKAKNDEIYYLILGIAILLILFVIALLFLLYKSNKSKCFKQEFNDDISLHDENQDFISNNNDSENIKSALNIEPIIQNKSQSIFSENHQIKQSEFSKTVVVDKKASIIQNIMNISIISSPSKYKQKQVLVEEEKLLDNK